MTSIIKVNNIKDSANNQAIAINNGVVTFSNPPIGDNAGKVLQVVSNISTTGTGHVTTPTAALAVSITPSATSSKVFVIAMGAGSVIWGSNGVLQAEIRRGTISGSMIACSYIGLSGSGPANGNEHYFTPVVTVTDSPSTTSSQTYTFAVTKGSGGTTSARIMGGSSFPITMTAMEIGV